MAVGPYILKYTIEYSTSTTAGFLGNNDVLADYLVGIKIDGETVATSTRQYTFSSGSHTVELELSQGIVPDGTFRLWTGITSVELDGQFTTIGEQAFLAASGITHFTLNCEYVESIGASAFAQMNGLWVVNNTTSPVLNFKSIRSLGASSLNGLVVGPVTLVFGDQLTTYGGSNGYQDAPISSQQPTGGFNIEFGTGLTTLYANSIDRCYVNNLICRATTPPTCTGNPFFQSTFYGSIEVPKDSVAAYRAATNWSTYYDRIIPVPYGWKLVQPVEYLEATGSQHIITETYGHEYTGFEVKFLLKSLVSPEDGNSATIFGSRDYFGGAGLQISTYQNGSFYYNTSLSANRGWDALNTTHTVKFYNGNLIVDGTNVGNYTGQTFTTPAPLYVFALYQSQNTSPKEREHLSGRIYSLKLYGINLDLIADFIPVRDENRVGYLYDKLSGKLYGNAGTGEFVLGEDLPHSYGGMYLGYTLIGTSGDIIPENVGYTIRNSAPVSGSTLVLTGSTSQYINSNVTMSWEYPKPFTLNVRVKHKSLAQWKQLVSSVTGQPWAAKVLNVSSDTVGGKVIWKLYCSSNNSSFDIANGVGNLTMPVTGSWYTYQVVFDGTYIWQQCKLDSDTTWTTGSKTAMSTGLCNGYYLTLGGGYQSSGTPDVDIDLEKTKLYISNKVVWTPMTSSAGTVSFTLFDFDGNYLDVLSVPAGSTWQDLVESGYEAYGEDSGTTWSFGESEDLEGYVGISDGEGAMLLRYATSGGEESEEDGPFLEDLPVDGGYYKQSEVEDSGEDPGEGGES